MGDDKRINMNKTLVICLCPCACGRRHRSTLQCCWPLLQWKHCKSSLFCHRRAYMARSCKENLHLGRLIAKHTEMSIGEKGPLTSKQFYFTTIEMKYHQSSVTK